MINSKSPDCVFNDYEITKYMGIFPLNIESYMWTVVDINMEMRQYLGILTVS